MLVRTDILTDPPDSDLQRGNVLALASGQAWAARLTEAVRRRHDVVR